MKLKAKRSLIILLVIAMVFSFAGCQSKEASGQKALFKPGTYTGEGEGIHGKIEVEVTVTENEIKEIKVLNHSETEGVSTVALEKMPAKII